MLVEEMQYNPSAGALQASTTYFEGPNGPAYSLSGESGSIPEWYIANGLGSVVGQIDANGNLQASGEYDIYGNARGVQSGTFTSNHRFVGQLGHTTDAETGGLVYMQARYYDPATGRFVSEDPGRSGENWYGYGGENPVNGVDATGNDASELPYLAADWIGGILILLGGAFMLVPGIGWGIGALMMAIGFATVLVTSLLEIANMQKLIDNGIIGKSYRKKQDIERGLERGDTDNAEVSMIDSALAVPAVGILIAVDLIEIEALCDD